MTLLASGEPQLNFEATARLPPRCPACQARSIGTPSKVEGLEGDDVDSIAMTLHRCLCIGLV